MRLPNGMRVLLVHDPSADKAAAAVDVRAGSLSDPRDIPGLAHFLEHMLFYSSERYPEEDAYSKFVTEHGGTTNAYTSGESTCYMFDINSSALEATLDRFAQFFICPLISEEGVGREVRAVDSEHGKNVNSDMWRQMQLWRGAADEAHPFSAFHTGNFETLMTAPKARGVKVHEAVRHFWEEHYSADVMCAAIVAPAGLDELEEMAISSFGGIVNKHLPQPRFSGDMFGAEDRGILLKVVPEKEWHTVEIQWAVPPETVSYRSQPCGTLSHLLGHEGAGSVFALLKERGLAVELAAGESGLSFSGSSLFSVTIVLTDKGHMQVDVVLGLVFDYIGGILSAAPVEKLLREVWDENTALSQLRFRFAEKMPPFSSAQSLAHAMQDYPEKDLLLAMHHVPLDFDAAAIEAVLACMTPEAARVMWASPDFKDEANEEEYYYGAKFSRDVLPATWLSRWKTPQPPPEMHLPRANTLISTDFELQQESWGRDSDPRQIVTLPLVSLWARPDTSFKLPRGSITISFKSPAAYADPEAAVMTKLFARLLSDALNEIAYDASLAGLHYGVDSSVVGWQLNASGYSHKLPHLVHLVLERMTHLKVDPTRFKVVREALQKDFLAMVGHQQPYERALYSSGILLEAPKWHVSQYLHVIDDITAKNLEAFLPSLFARVHATAYVSGNIPLTAAEKLAADVAAALEQGTSARPPWSGQMPARRTVKLPIGRDVALREPSPNPSNINSAIAVSFQFGLDDMRRNALGQLVAHLAKRDAFAELRTRQQLGYIVHLAPWSTLTCRSLIILIQSTSFSAQHLSDCIEAFLGTFWERLSTLPQSEFDDQVKELIAAKLEAPQRLREVTSRHWGELDAGTHVWNRPVAESEALRHVTLSELQSFYKEFVLECKTRSQLSVLVSGATPPSNGGETGGETGDDLEAVGESSSPGTCPNEAVSDSQTAELPTMNGPSTVNEFSLVDNAAVSECKTDDSSPINLTLDDIWEFKRKQQLYAAS